MKDKLLVLLLICLVSSCKDNKKEDNGIETSTKTGIVEIPVNKISLKEKEYKSTKELEMRLKSKGYETFYYVDEKTQDTTLMQKYFIAFLKNGPIRNQNEEEANQLQSEHMAHLSKMYELGYADISGPFDDDGDIRGITIYNVPTLQMADSLANADPMVKAGRLVIEVHPWWAAKGFPLR